MRFSVFLCVAIVVSSCSAQKEGPWVSSDISFVKPAFAEKQADMLCDFRLSYMEAGMGSQFAMLKPVFEVYGNEYQFYLEQNSYWGEPNLKPEFVGEGMLRQSSVDSIIHLVSFLHDTSIYQTDPYISSGAIHSLHIRTRYIDVSYALHNAYDPIAAKIVAILNSNLPEEQRRLWIFPARTD